MPSTVLPCALQVFPGRPAELQRTFASQPPIGRSGYQKGPTLSAARQEREAPWPGAQHPRFPAPKEPPCCAGPSSCPASPPGPWRTAVPLPWAGGTICAAQVCPPSGPTWGWRTLGRLWPPASPVGSCARTAICERQAEGQAGGGVAAGGEGGAAGTHPR